MSACKVDSFRNNLPALKGWRAMELRANGRRAKGSGVREVYETLRNEILTLDLRPGAHLDETALAERFKLSRSPIREALIRLSGDGLVRTLSNRSTLVAPFDISTFPKYIEALDLLQRVNTRLAARLRSDDDIARIRERQAAFVEAVGRGISLELSETNRDFHLAIATAGKNPYLTEQYARLLDEGRRMMHLHFDYLKSAIDEDILSDEHDEMIQAVVEQDAERAERLAHDHTRQFRNRFFDYLAQNLAGDMSVDPLDEQKP